MLTSRQVRYAYLPLMLIGLSALGGLAAIVVREGLSEGAAEFWLLAWVLAFVLALPAAMLLLAVAGLARRVWHRLGTVPSAGGNVPEVGQ